MRSGIALAAACLLAVGSGGAGEISPEVARAASHPGGESSPTRDLIPAAGDGLERIGECEVYAGEALYDYVDGAAPQYFEYGFHEVASQEVRLRGRTFILDLYRMADPAAAFGIFSTRRPERCVALDAFARSCFTGYQGLIAEGPYLLDIQAYETSDSTARQMSELAARALRRDRPAPGIGDTERRAAGVGDASGRDAGIDSLLSILPGIGRKPGSERWAKGPIGLGAALGPAAGGACLRALESVEKAMPAPAMVAVTGPRSGTSPIWLVGDYHADSAGESPTTLIVLRNGPPPQELLSVIRAAGLVSPEADSLAPAPGWLVSGSNGSCWAATARGRDLLLASSRLSPDTLRAWILRVVSR